MLAEGQSEPQLGEAGVDDRGVIMLGHQRPRPCRSDNPDHVALVELRREQRVHGLHGSRHAPSLVDQQIRHRIGGRLRSASMHGVQSLSPRREPASPPVTAAAL